MEESEHSDDCSFLLDSLEEEEEDKVSKVINLDKYMFETFSKRQSDSLLNT